MEFKNRSVLVLCKSIFPNLVSLQLNWKRLFWNPNSANSCRNPLAEASWYTVNIFYMLLMELQITWIIHHWCLCQGSQATGRGAAICSQQGPSSWRPVSTPLLHALPLRATAEAVAVMSLWRWACGPLLLKVWAFWGNFFIFFTSKKRNTCSGYFHLQPVQLEEEDGTNIRSMCNRISKLNHGLSVILLKEYNKYLFRGNGNVSREDKYKK